MLFALVDDATEILEQIPPIIKSLLSYYDVKVDCFQNAHRLLDVYKDQKYDALFLDIDMPEINGFDLTSLIKENNPNAHIIYLTGRDDLITNAFRYRPLGFVRKQNIDTELPFAIETILKVLDKEELKITITETRAKGGRTHTILIKQIQYIESCNHSLTIYLDNQELCIRDSLSHFSDMAEFRDFVAINSGTLVNMAHIELVNDTVKFEDGKTLLISRRKLPDVIKSYLNFTKKVLI